MNLEYIYGLTNELSVYPLFDLMHTVNKLQDVSENLYAFGLGIKIDKKKIQIESKLCCGWCLQQSK